MNLSLSEMLQLQREDCYKVNRWSGLSLNFRNYHSETEYLDRYRKNTYCFAYYLHTLPFDV